MEDELFGGRTLPPVRGVVTLKGLRLDRRIFGRGGLCFILLILSYLRRLLL